MRDAERGRGVGHCASSTVQVGMQSGGALHVPFCIGRGSGVRGGRGSLRPIQLAGINYKIHHLANAPNVDKYKL